MFLVILGYYEVLNTMVVLLNWQIYCVSIM